MERNTAADSCGLALDFQSSLVQFVGIRYPNYVTINIVGSTFNTMQTFALWKARVCSSKYRS